MSLKDLCTIDLLPELMEAGIDSFKIEGRMKQPDYVYTVTKPIPEVRRPVLPERQSRIPGIDRG